MVLDVVLEEFFPCVINPFDFATLQYDALKVKEKRYVRIMLRTPILAVHMIQYCAFYVD